MSSSNIIKQHSRQLISSNGDNLLQQQQPIVGILIMSLHNSGCQLPLYISQQQELVRLTASGRSCCNRGWVMIHMEAAALRPAIKPGVN